ncbi:hypothetical protein VNO78_01827 [Psophocarpus tetragonolobus]|uniref:Uncharacterized protein n=1 Tax=Psophocarpus tetragonolobus TaxID=3891 RepID=A0AAN9XVQ1_PSOTE
MLDFSLALAVVPFLRNYKLLLQSLALFKDAVDSTQLLHDCHMLLQVTYDFEDKAIPGPSSIVRLPQVHEGRGEKLLSLGG